MTPKDTYSDKGPICPYCGHQHIAGDDPEIYYNEDMTEHECNSCGREFEVRAWMSWEWFAEAKNEEDNQ